MDLWGENGSTTAVWPPGALRRSEPITWVHTHAYRPSGRSSMQEADLPATNAFTGERWIRFITSVLELSRKIGCREREFNDSCQRWRLFTRRVMLCFTNSWWSLCVCALIFKAAFSLPLPFPDSSAPFLRQAAFLSPAWNGMQRKCEMGGGRWRLGCVLNHSLTV